MDRKRTVPVFAFLVSLLLAGCQAMPLPNYSSDVGLRLYGDVIGDEEIPLVEAQASEFANCLFTVKAGSVNEELILALAPNEDVQKWNTVYTKNRTNSDLQGFQVTDIYAETEEEVSCLCVCEAVYSDWKTPEDTYLFIVRMKMAKREGQWQIRDSELLGAARKTETMVVRDDITGGIKFTERGGEQE